MTMMNRNQITLRERFYSTRLESYGIYLDNSVESEELEYYENAIKSTHLAYRAAFQTYLNLRFCNADTLDIVNKMLFLRDRTKKLSKKLDKAHFREDKNES